jgi:prepilin-type processing-associated H-X9-DG protein
MQSAAAANPDFIQAGRVYPYINTIVVYRCPADRSTFPLNTSYGKPRLRSVSMNCWMNPIRSWNAIRGYSGANQLAIFRKQSDFTVLGASMANLFMDEHPNAIDDGFFVCDPNQPNTWVNVPASYHNNANGLSFADGHAEIKKWRDASMLKASGSGVTRDPNSGDLAWLMARSTVKQQ